MSAETEIARRIQQRIEAALFAMDGAAQQAEWHCEDGWVVIYTTTRVKGGPHDGKFLCQAFKPTGKGARGGRGAADEWVQTYRREFSTRKAAKARAIALYARHSPRWSDKEGERQ